MRIEITGKNLDLTVNLDAFIREKLGSLGRFIQKYEDLGEVELKATIERVTAHHHKGEVFRAAGDLLLPKRNLHAEEISDDAHTAIDILKRKLHAEIEKYKDEH